MNFDLEKIAFFGVAGNFTGHLEQAGEAKDFEKMKVDEKNAPKAVFPTYIPGQTVNIPERLTVFPFDSSKIVYPENETKIQIEPECAVIFNAFYKDGKISALEPLCFGASNDCSIRKEGAVKISMKKNWGKSSKGLSDNLISMEEFCEKDKVNEYRIASFLCRNGELFEYGEDSAIRDYSYVYKKLIDWLILKFQTQKDEGPAENICEYLKESGFPKTIMISIGATRYTEFGKTNFLKKDDYSIVVLYPENKYTLQDIKDLIIEKDYSNEDISFLVQEIK